MNRMIHTLVFILAAFAGTAQQNSAATQILERFRAKMEEYTASEMNFTFTGADAKGVSFLPLEGVIYRTGNDWTMLNPEVEVYVHGDTKWIYTTGNNEAIIMQNDPASVDLTENPLALFSAQLSKEYRLSDKPKFFNDKGQEITEITLIPAGKNMPYTSILLRIKSQTLTPHSVKYNAKDGGWFEAVITDYIHKNQPFPPERFIFSIKEHTGVFVTDLR